MDIIGFDAHSELEKCQEVSAYNDGRLYKI